MEISFEDAKKLLRQVKNLEAENAQLREALFEAQNFANKWIDNYNMLQIKTDWLRERNAQLRTALETTQDIAKMASLAVDVRMTLNPSKAVEYFNRTFPEVEKALVATKPTSSG